MFLSSTNPLSDNLDILRHDHFKLNFLSDSIDPKMAFNDTLITVNDSTPLNQPIKYVPEVASAFLEETREKLGLARYPEEQSDFGPDDWSQGAKVHEVSRLAEYWHDTYDWSSRAVSACDRI